jgi:ABC-2 type transport system permease protein
MATFSLALRRTLAHRVDFAFDVLAATIGIGTVLATTLAIFHQTHSLAGWSRAKVFVLIGIFSLVQGIRASLIDPSLTTFVETIRDGTLDEALLRPAPSWFTATSRDHAPLALGQAVLGLGILTAGLTELPTAPGPWSVAVAVTLIGCAVVISWAISLIIASLAFWAGRLELFPMTASLWQIGQYPAGIYGRGLRITVTYFLPLAGMITFPAEVLTRIGSPGMLIGGLGAAAAFATLAIVIFRLGLRRYTGATS